MNRRNQVLRALICLVAAATSVPGGAVFPDRPASDFKSVGMLGTVTDGKFKISGSGVAISKNWVIGVSHVGGNVFIQEGKEYLVEKKIVPKPVNGEVADLALYKLATPVPHFANVALKPFAGSGGLKGRVVQIIGCGKTSKLRSDGLGWQPIESSEGSRRGATNTIDGAEIARYNIGSGAKTKLMTCKTLVYDLDKPGSTEFNTIGSGATPQEGGVGARDSGGGWFVKEGDQMKLVAISATVSKAPGSSMPSPYCFGSLGFGIHLQPYKGWIYSVTNLGQFK